jgi:hypothetical protein
MGRGLPTPTPARRILFERGITAADVARDIGLRYSSLSNLLKVGHVR